jgi:hypothetical protein
MVHNIIMEKSNYNSLTDKLIQNGIISSSNNDNVNIFEKYYDIEPNEDYSKSPFHNNADIKTDDTVQSKKRINEYDLNLLKQDISSVASPIKKSPFDRFLFRFFPRIYKAKIIKKTMKKFFELNIDTKTLFKTPIPYGESEIHYNELIKYLKCANELQTELSENS